MSIRTSVVVLFALLVSVPSVGFAQAPPRDLTPEQQAQWRKLMEDLREARSAVNALKDTRARDRLEQSLDRLELGIRRFAELPDRPAAPRKVAISAADFTKLTNAIKAEAFDDKRSAVLKLAVGQTFFTSEQAKTVIGLFTFSPGQKEAALMLYPRLTDPVNFPSALEVMKFASDRQEVLKAVSGK